MADRSGQQSNTADRSALLPLSLQPVGQARSAFCASFCAKRSHPPCWLTTPDNSRPFPPLLRLSFHPPPALARCLLPFCLIPLGHPVEYNISPPDTFRHTDKG